MPITFALNVCMQLSIIDESLSEKKKHLAIITL